MVSVLFVMMLSTGTLYNLNRVRIVFIFATAATTAAATTATTAAATRTFSASLTVSSSVFLVMFFFGLFHVRRPFHCVVFFL